jgi:hypothetical protein
VTYLTSGCDFCAAQPTAFRLPLQPGNKLLMELRTVLVFSLLLLLASTAAAPAQVSLVAENVQVLPVDEAVRDPQLLATRSQLMAAAKKHDFEPKAKLTDPNIRTECGKHGIPALREFFTASHDGWHDFYRSLQLGGVFRQPLEFSSNYLVSRFPQNLQPEDYEVVVGEDAALREQPDNNSGVIAHLSHNVVTRLADSGDWVKVQVGTGATVYLQRDELGSPTGLTVTLNRLRGKWLITAVQPYCD